MGAGNVQIYDIMACNVYWDFETPGTPKEQHKFLVAFYPTGGAPLPELIQSITAYGPDGYKVDVANQTFTGVNKNGHIFDRTTNSHWYMVNLDTGFMKPGEYKIEVVTKDGKVVSKSRLQQDEPSKALVGSYLKNRGRIYESFSPGQGGALKPGAPRDKVEIRWSSLKTLADQDAYYIFRLSAGTNGKEFDTQNLHWWDNIFVQRAGGDAKAGLNRDKVLCTNALEAGKPYVYFTEITDSNAMGETNICVFQPHQSFRA
jgi:hypothetical protein